MNFFDISELNSWEREIVLSLALLADKNYAIPDLARLFQVEEDELPVFFDTIHDLSIKKFLVHNKTVYRLSAENKKSILKKYTPTSENCPILLNYFFYELKENKKLSKESFYNLFEDVASLIENIYGESLHLAQLNYLVSANLTRFKKFEESLIYSNNAISISEAVDDSHPVVALFYRDKAMIHKFLGNSDKAIICSLKDIEILEKHAGKYDDLLPDSYFSLSKSYEQQKNYIKAAEYGLKAVKFEKKRQKKRVLNLSGLYHNLAYYYVKLNNLKNASLFMNKAVESFIQANSNNEEYYKALLNDQKKFNSLFEFEKFFYRYRYILLGLGFIFLALLVWAVFMLF